MMKQQIVHFAPYLEKARQLPEVKIAVAAAEDAEVLEGVRLAAEEGVATPILVGAVEKIKQLADQVGLSLDGVELVDQPNPKEAAREATRLVREGKADVLMKGMLQTADLMRAVLDEKIGLRTGRLLTHVGIFDVPTFDRLVMVSDGGIAIAPTLEQKATVVQNAIELAHGLGIVEPKVALLAAVELVNPAMPATLDAASLTKMADRGQIKGGLVDGPLALDNAVNMEAAKHKKISSPVAGQADILIVPDIEAGNILSKSLVYFANSTLAGVVMGAAKPIVLTSRADTPLSKMLSIAAAALVSRA
jgi:phosphate butyryltransferase